MNILFAIVAVTTSKWAFPISINHLYTDAITDEVNTHRLAEFDRLKVSGRQDTLTDLKQ